MSGKRLQLKRGTTAQTSTFTGLNGEVTVDTTKKTLVVHDGSTIGGTVLAKDSALNSHTARTDNPHAVTKAQVGLANVDNTSDANKPVSTAQQTALNLKANLDSPTFTGTVSGITKSMVGLPLADNTADSAKNVLSATKLTTARTIGGVLFDGTANINLPGVNAAGNQSTTGNAATATKWQTARTITLNGDLTGSVSIDGSANVILSAAVAANSIALGTDTTGNYVAGNTAGTGIVVTGTEGEGWIPTITLSNVGTAGTYRSVTTDAQGRITAGTNPTTVSGYGLTDVYTITESNTSLALKVNNSEKGVANGVSTLDANGKVVLTQIPDSVLGQLEYMGTWNFATLPTATQKGQYWIASVSGNGYVVGDWAVWNGTAFDKVDNTDAVATVAGRTGNVVLTKTDVGLANVDNTADTAKPVSTAQATAIGLKADSLTVSSHTGNISNPHSVTKAQVGLGNVDNTSDASKPVSTAQQTALDLKANLASPTFTGTVTAPTFSGALSGNAATATALQTTRNVALTGAVTGNANFDGSANISIATTLVSAGIPSGGIILWSGAVASIPAGWYLCNGANGTPNLQDRFIVGAGSGYAVGATGGSANAVVVSHSHTASTNSTGAHTHTYLGMYNDRGPSNASTAPVYQNTQTTSSSGAHSHTVSVESSGESGTNKNLPPYYALAFIMKT